MSEELKQAVFEQYCRTYWQERLENAAEPMGHEMAEDWLTSGHPEEALENVAYDMVRGRFENYGGQIFDSAHISDFMFHEAAEYILGYEAPDPDALEWLTDWATDESYNLDLDTDCARFLSYDGVVAACSHAYLQHLREGLYDLIRLSLPLLLDDAVTERDEEESEDEDDY